MMLAKLSKKEKIGLFIAAIFIFLVILDKLIITPMNRKFRGLNQEIKMAENRLSRHLRNLSQKETVTMGYRKYIPYVKKIGSDEEEVAKILAEIEELARKSKISLAGIKPQAPKEVNFYKEYVVEIEANGIMECVTNFLYQLNNSTQLLRAEKLRLSSKGKEASSVIKASILITKILIP